MANKTPKGRWSPVQLEVILWHYYTPAGEVHPNVDIQAYNGAISSLKFEGLIVPNTEAKYRGTDMITDRGKAFVELLKQTPLPVSEFVDPRNEEVVKRI